jgi:hypothetical protein
MANRGAGKPFTKGDTRINRKGRPKVGESLSSICRDALLEVLDPATGYRRIDSLIDKMTTQAQQGNDKARTELLTRAFGKPVERIEQTNVNQNYDFSNLSLEERMKLLEQIKSARATVIQDNPDKL